MKKNGLILGIIFAIIFSACDNELHITLPEGPQGSSAYEVWVEGVQNGTISWDKNYTDLNNFFLFLKGKDGKDGINGKSAYIEWGEEVAKGIADPQNQGKQWDKSKTSIQDFWRYLTGAQGQSGSTPTVGSNGNWFIDGKDSGIAAKGKDGQNGSNGQDGSVVTIGANGNWFIDGKDTKAKAFGVDGQDGENGKSAYELWGEEVAKGIDDPHNQGQLWDKSKTSTQDFWTFLRGNDGTNGEGKNIEIVKGVPNVIPQYSNQANNEFVRLDGSAMYFVYNNLGQKVGSGVSVTKLPGMDPSKTYTTDADGSFMILKDDLPTSKLKAERSGTSLVTYNKDGSVVTENSAKNTYVPAKIDVRMRLVAGSDLIQTYMRIKVLVERKTEPDGTWEVIPTHLGEENQSIAAFGVSDSQDPSSYNTGKVYRMSSTTYNIKENPITVQIHRLRRGAPYIAVDARDKWDGNRQYLTLVLDSYYGEKPHLSGIIEMAPIQAMPFIRTDNMTATESIDPEVNSKSLLTLSGSLDIAGANLDASIIYQKALKVTAQTNYDLCSPVKLDYKTVDLFRIFLQKDTNTSQNYSGVSNPNFELFQPLYNADFSLTVTGETQYSHCFYSYNKIGVLKKIGVKQYAIEPASSFPAIPIRVTN